MLALVRESIHMSNGGELMTTRAKHTQQLVPSNAVIPNLDKGAPLERTFLAAYLYHCVRSSLVQLLINSSSHSHHIYLRVILLTFPALLFSLYLHFLKFVLCLLCQL